MRTLALFGLIVCPGLAWCHEMSPRDFAYGQLVLPSREAVAAADTPAAYRFALPLAVYQNTVREDLTDLRVFNGEGVVIPYSLSRPAARSTASQTSVEVPLFPLHDGARVSLDGVRVIINSAGSVVDLQTQNAIASSNIIRQYLLDARGIDAALSRLQLRWPDGAPQYIGRLNIEVSEDLTSWRELIVAPIANLRASGQSLIENQVDLPATKAKFWRLTWLGAVPPFELSAVTAGLSSVLSEPDRTALDVVGVPDSTNANEYLFDLGAHVPVSRINVLLPELNSVLNVELSSRPTPIAPWRPVVHANFYRIKTDDGEQQNAALSLNSDTDRYWRARLIGDDSGPRSPLRLHVEWVPNEITFLAEGHAPFLLAYGNAAATRGEADLGTLPNGLKIAPATLGPAQITGGINRLIPKPAPFPLTRAALWSVLILAVVLLGWMAYRIAGESKEIR